MTSLQERLFAMQDKQYAAFQAKLTPGVPVESFIGIPGSSPPPLPSNGTRRFPTSSKTALLPGRTTRPSRRPSRATESRPSRRNICGH